jgi:hypothetical protein
VQANKALPDFGEPLDEKLLLNFARIDRVRDMQSASDWFDEHASEKWRGALENKPVNKRKPK